MERAVKQSWVIEFLRNLMIRFSVEKDRLASGVVMGVVVGRI